MLGSRGQHWNIFSCECEDNLLHELGGIQPDPGDFVVASKAAYAVPQSTSVLPDTSDSLCSLLTLTLQHHKDVLQQQTLSDIHVRNKHLAAIS